MSEKYYQEKYYRVKLYLFFANRALWLAKKTQSITHWANEQAEKWVKKADSKLNMEGATE